MLYNDKRLELAYNYCKLLKTECIKEEFDGQIDKVDSSNSKRFLKWRLK